jgi:hypothetical protein
MAPISRRPRASKRKLLRRRPGMRRPRKGIRNHLSKKAYSSATDSINKKFIVATTVAPTQGVTVANYLYYFFPLIDQNAGIPTLLSNQGEFILNCAMYDRFRVRGITVKYTPHANAQDNALNQNDAYNYGGDGLMHSVVDRNGVPSSADMGTFMRYGSHKQKSLLKTQSRSYWVKYPTNVWFQCASPPTPSYITSYGGWGLTGGVGWYAENLLEDSAELFNETIGVFSITYHVEFSGKLLPKILKMVDLSGNTVVGLQSSRVGQNPLMIPGETLIDDGTKKTTVYNATLVDLSGTVIPV